MQDVLDIIKNIENIYDSNNAFQVLKDFERVLDELDVYVYDNWEKGELAAGPDIGRHWVTCTFMWKKDEMPDPMGGKRLLDYDCKVKYKRSSLITPRKIRKPDDMRPGTKKGKLDTVDIWLVEIQMPIKLIGDIYAGVMEPTDMFADKKVPSQDEPADELNAESADTGAADTGNPPDPLAGATI